MTETNRQQRMTERILEDESLRGELEDPAATALINWASERAGTFAADRSRSDPEVEAATLAIRTAARQAASSGEQEPEHVIALAEAALAEQSPNQASEAAATVPQPPALSNPASEPDRNEAAVPGHAAERSASGATKAPVSMRRSKRRQHSRRKSK
jgi:hypothetical protein